MQIGQEVGGLVMPTIQPSILELVEAARVKCVQEFNATIIPEVAEAVRVKCVQDFNATIIPEVVKAVRSQCALEFQAFTPLLVAEMKKVVDSSSLSSSSHQAESSAPRSLQLHFDGCLPDTLYTQTKIPDKLRVELRDSCGSRVEEGPESSAQVRLVVLNGDFEVAGRTDWTKEEFSRNKANPREGKGSLLKGKSEMFLSNGVADVTDIVVFTDNSKSMRNGTFRLGAELVNGVAREAVSKKPFMVKERRLIINNGSPLLLEDSTRRLKYIGDTSSQKLAVAKIHTVKDFLQLYHTNPEALRKTAPISENKLSETVRIAESCLLAEEGYTYSDDTVGVNLVLDCVFNIINVTFKGQASQAYENLDKSQKALVNKLRDHAYMKREELPRKCVQNNPMPGPTSIHPITIPYAGATAEVQGYVHTGELLVNNNSNMENSFGNDDWFQRFLDNPIESLDRDWFGQCSAGSTLMPEERRTEFCALNASSDCATGCTSNIQAVTCVSDELGTRRYSAKWIRVRAVVKFKVVPKVSVKLALRAAKGKDIADH